MSSFATINTQPSRGAPLRNHSPRRLLQSLRGLRNQSVAQGYTPSRILSSLSSRRQQVAPNPPIQSVELVASDAFIFSGPSPDCSSTDNLSWSQVDSNMPSRRPSTVFSTNFQEDIQQDDHDYMDIEMREDMRPVHDDSSYNLLDDNCEIRQQILQQCLEYMDITSLRTLRLCNKTWQQTIDAYRQLKFPAVYRLPYEIIQAIYKFLPPSDFNAARHSCHAWMSASLDVTLLKTMLSRCGHADGNDTTLAGHVASRAREIPDAWRLSCRLARECAMLPDWTGTGLPKPMARHAEDVTPRPLNALAVRYKTDFTELSNAGYPSTNQVCGLGFTMSNCGRYLLIAEGCSIYVYHLNSTSCRPVTTVVCPKRVLAMSMDTTAMRHSLAALLDGRMGMVCDLDNDPMTTEPPSPQIYSDRSLEDDIAQRASFFPTHYINGHSSHFAPHSNDVYVATPSSGHSRDGLTRVNSIHVLSAHQSVHLRNASIPTEHNSVIPAWPHLCHTADAYRAGSSQSIPISSTPLSIYHSLCSADDPPRSVAICPSRRCLAFGCGAGIELHWVDAMSGRNLMKWFPLTTSSDFLCFLPSRRNVDNPNKLRLISSKAGPGQCGGTERFGRRRKSNRHFVWSWGRGVREADYDHYAALPLSDGAHVLYTLPESGALYLGSDAPLGNATKLLRKILFEPPRGIICSKEFPVSMYAAGTDLTCGVRVVAVYQDDLVLYTVPPDVFRDIKSVNDSTGVVAAAHDELPGSATWKEWWEPSPMASWPMVIRGAKIGHLDNIVDLAVQSSPDLVVWAVSSTGIAVTFIPTDGSTQQIVHRHIEQDGSVHMVVREADPRSAQVRSKCSVSSSWNVEQERTARTESEGDAFMNDADLAYDLAYTWDPESSHPYRPFAGHADRDSQVSMLPGGFADAGAGSSRLPRYDLDGVCEFEIQDGATVDYSACISIYRQPSRNATKAEEVAKGDLPAEVLCGDLGASSPSNLPVRVANMSAKRASVALKCGSQQTPASS